MRVLVFTSLFPNNVWPNHGVFVKERMVNYGQVSQCQLDVVAPVPYFPPVQLSHRWLYSKVVRREIIEGLTVYHPRYLMVPKIGMVVHGWMMFLSVLPFLKKLHRQCAFDIIDAHYIYPDGFTAILLGRYLRLPVVVSARGSDINQFSTFPVIRKYLKYTLAQASGVIAVCEALKVAMVDLGVHQNKISVVPNGVDTSKFYHVSRVQAREELGLPNRKIILSVGSLIPRKGFDLLIEAFRDLQRQFPDEELYLVIVGEGLLRSQLQKMVSSMNLERQVRLAGDVPHDQLYLWYSAADVFCLASNREGWPNVVLESLACGTPVVATAVWGTPEIISSDEIGILIQRDTASLTMGLSTALRKHWNVEQIVKYAKMHTWEKVAQSVGHVFTSALNQPQDHPFPCGQKSSHHSDSRDR